MRGTRLHLHMWVDQGDKLVCALCPWVHPKLLGDTAFTIPKVEEKPIEENSTTKGEDEEEDF